MSAPEARKPSLLPAVFALALIAALAAFAWMRRSGERHDEPARAQAPAATKPTEGPISAPAPTAPAVHAPTAAGGAASTLRPEDEPQLSQEEPPEAKAKKPKLTLDEKLVLTQQHIGVMQTRAELLGREIEQLDSAGKKDEADQKRVMLTRLKAHMEKLRTAIAEHREPE